MGVQFNPNFPPHFYSGNPFDRKLIFILKNPLESNNQFMNDYIQAFHTIPDFSSFVQQQNDDLLNFNPINNAPFYQNCDVFTEHFIDILHQNDEQLAQYFEFHALNQNMVHNPPTPLLSAARHSCIIDLFPFFSNQFTLKINKQTVDPTLRYFMRILHFLNTNCSNNGPCIIVNGNSFLNDSILSNFDVEGYFMREILSEKLNFSSTSGTIYKFDTGNTNLKFFSVSNWGGQGLSHNDTRQYADWVFNHLN